MKKHRVKGYESLQMASVTDAYRYVDGKYGATSTERLRVAADLGAEPFSVQISKVQLPRSQLKNEAKKDKDDSQVKLLKSIKNKYYLRREHLNPAASSQVAKTLTLSTISRQERTPERKPVAVYQR